MRITITGKGMEVSDYLKNMVEKKVGKLKRYFKEDTQANVTMSIEKSRHIIEVTIPFDGVILRGKLMSGDMYASVDGVLKKLESQIHKHKTKLEKRLHQDAFSHETYLFNEEMAQENLPKIVRTKRFALKPMDASEAAMQMELLEHNFFVYRNSRTDEVNVLYKRNDGDYGLIEPDDV